MSNVFTGNLRLIKARGGVTRGMSAKKGWNIISRSYQQKTRISLEDVHYGPISAGERELKLLGSVRKKDVLEIGCGGRAKRHCSCEMGC